MIKNPYKIVQSRRALPKQSRDAPIRGMPGPNAVEWKFPLRGNERDGNFPLGKRGVRGTDGVDLQLEKVSDHINITVATCIFRK